jgi:mercuric ion transport protein
VRVETSNSGSAQTGSGALLVGGVAAILASTCCLGPLVLVVLGLSGVWIGNLSLLEPYRPSFIAGALVALFFAGRRIFRPAQTCQPVRCAPCQGLAAFTKSYLELFQRLFLSRWYFRT